MYNSDALIAASALAAYLSVGSATSEVLAFDCVWENRDHVTITVDTDKRTGWRDDGGQPYILSYHDENAVYLQIEHSVGGVLTQSIQRSKPTGKWTDVLVNAEIGASAWAGGECGEQ